MLNLNQARINQILEHIDLNFESSSKEIYDALQDDISYATIKRILQKLVSENQVIVTGKGRITKYKVSPSYNLVRTINVDAYFEKDIDDRNIKSSFDISVINETLSDSAIFSKLEQDYLNNLQAEYEKNISKLSQAEYKKELERLAIDLSWKSSQIEGNTYSLLETERLIKEKELAEGKTKDEATMLLNHKSALDFIIANPNYVKPLTIASIEDIHSILIKDLNIDRNIRKRKVGISGTNYAPLDNDFQIREALEAMITLINKQDSVFAEALLVLVLLSYIQAFADGNKRTARIISNAILMNNNHCPLSFRTINSIDYKKAMLLFYEQNNLQAFKKIFIDQFTFAVKTYF